MHYACIRWVREAAKKYFYSDPATKRGGGTTTKKKLLFLGLEKKSEKYVATKLERLG